MVVDLVVLRVVLQCQEFRSFLHTLTALVTKTAPQSLMALHWQCAADQAQLDTYN